jgi:hypothetical protein
VGSVVVILVVIAIAVRLDKWTSQVKEGRDLPEERRFAQGSRSVGGFDRLHSGRRPILRLQKALSACWGKLNQDACILAGLARKPGMNSACLWWLDSNSRAGATMNPAEWQIA